MDFFEHQDAARRRTLVLVVYFALAVGLIVAAIYFSAVGVMLWLKAEMQVKTPVAGLWDLRLFAWTAGGTLAVILCGSLYRIISLSSGGRAVAEMLGGRRVDPSTRDLAERRLLNVVEEMAIASGFPVPPVYVLESEKSINAFAAGFSQRDAVVAATRGCIELLSRDELQGVTAHEFSHILNGDMRLNIRLMGILNGILLIGLLGQWVLRSAARVSSGRISGRKRGGGAFPVVLGGLALMAIGYIGFFFGRLIQSAVSRQREFLADAAAVQFTRNPGGIAGALRKIGGLAIGSTIGSVQAEEASHFFFADGITRFVSGLFATHPPLAERIRRIDPRFDGRFPQVKAAVREGQATARFAALPKFAGPAQAKIPLRPEDVVSTVGTVRPDQLAYSASFLGSLPEDLKMSAASAAGARALVYCLLLDRDETVRQRQLDVLARNAEAAAAAEAGRLLPLVEAAGPAARLPILGLCIRSLRTHTPAEFDRFIRNVDLLVETDRQVSLFEYVLKTSLARHLEPTFRKARPPVVQYYSLRPLVPLCAKLLSALAYCGAADAAKAAQAFDLAIGRFRPDQRGRPALVPHPQCGLNDVDEALRVLGAASPQIKKRVMDACAACVAFDGFVTVEEGELLRAVADCLDCPLPPILPS